MTNLIRKKTFDEKLSEIGKSYNNQNYNLVKKVSNNSKKKNSKKNISKKNISKKNISKKNISKKTISKKNIKKNIKKDIKKDPKIIKQERESNIFRSKMGEIICTICNFAIVFCLIIFIYVSNTENNKDDSLVYYWGMRICTFCIFLSIIGYFLKYKDLISKLLKSFSLWEQNITFDIQVQFYLSIFLLLILQLWKFIVDSNYENIFETKTPIFILTGVIVLVALINIIISIANTNSFSGSFVTDLKDNALKYLGLDFLASDSTNQNPFDEFLSDM